MVEVVKRCQVSPAASSVSTKKVPLSFFDMLWTICPPMRRFFFYDFPHSTDHFLDAIFPTLKRSLALALQRFFPLAGNLILPPQPHQGNKPHILCKTHDSIPLIVAESSGCDFDHLIADYPREAKLFYPLVPDFPKSHVFSDGTRVLPLLAIQITLFPNRGLCICVAFHHVVADGIATHQFIKSWASFYTNGDGGLLPCHCRGAVNNLPNGLDLEAIFLRELSRWNNPVLDIEKPIMDLAPVNKVRATFVITRTQIETFKTWVSAQSVDSKELELEHPLRLSTFIVTCSLIWSCLIKSADCEESYGDCDVPDEDHEMCYLVFVADCRNRLKDPLPVTYFGNCLDMCVVGLQKKELRLKPYSNIVAVVKAVGKRVKEFEREPLKMADRWFSDWRRCDESGRLITIAGSPKLRAYETEFGWGRPQKSEVLHVDTSKAVSVQECRDQKGGIEIGLGLSNTQMDRFIAIWEQYLKLLCS